MTVTHHSSCLKSRNLYMLVYLSARLSSIVELLREGLLILYRMHVGYEREQHFTELDNSAASQLYGWSGLTCSIILHMRPATARKMGESFVTQ
jgi:hypothetical protein